MTKHTERLQRYLDRLGRARQHDHEHIHGFDAGEPTEALLLASDIQAAINQVKELETQPTVEPVATGKWFTVVYKNVVPGDEAALIGSHPKASALSWSHAMDDRDEALAKLAAAPNALDAETAIKNCLEAGETMRVLKRVVNLLLESRRNLGPEDHELRDRIDQLFRPDAAIAAQSARGVREK